MVPVGGAAVSAKVPVPRKPRAGRLVAFRLTHAYGVPPVREKRLIRIPVKALPGPSLPTVIVCLTLLPAWTARMGWGGSTVITGSGAATVTAALSFVTEVEDSPVGSIAIRTCSAWLPGTRLAPSKVTWNGLKLRGGTLTSDRASR